MTPGNRPASVIPRQTRTPTSCSYLEWKWSVIGALCHHTVTATYVLTNPMDNLEKKVVSSDGWGMGGATELHHDSPQDLTTGWVFSAWCAQMRRDENTYSDSGQPSNGKDKYGSRKAVKRCAYLDGWNFFNTRLFASSSAPREGGDSGWDVRRTLTGTRTSSRADGGAKDECMII